MMYDELPIGTRIRQYGNTRTEYDDGTIESLGPEDATKVFEQPTYWVRWDDPVKQGWETSLWWQDSYSEILREVECDRRNEVEI